MWQVLFFQCVPFISLLNNVDQRWKVEKKNALLSNETSPTAGWTRLTGALNKQMLYGFCLQTERKAILCARIEVHRIPVCGYGLMYSPPLEVTRPFVNEGFVQQCEERSHTRRLLESSTSSPLPESIGLKPSQWHDRQLFFSFSFFFNSLRNLQLLGP